MTGSLRVYVDFDTRDDPIAGRLSTHEGEQPFTGWLGLISALEERDRPARPGRGPRGIPGGGGPSRLGRSAVAGRLGKHLASGVRGLHGIDPLEEAVALAAASSARLEHARALVTLGGALRRTGRITAARERLRAGLELAAALGALRLQQRAHAELLAAGVKPRRRRIEGAEGLTAAERRVAEAAAGGMTNREIAEAFFISLRMVETHLAHAYQKLGIQTRNQLRETLSTVDADVG